MLRSFFYLWAWLSFFLLTRPAGAQNKNATRALRRPPLCLLQHIHAMPMCQAKQITNPPHWFNCPTTEPSLQ